MGTALGSYLMWYCNLRSQQDPSLLTKLVALLFCIGLAPARWKRSNRLMKMLGGFQELKKETPGGLRNPKNHLKNALETDQAEDLLDLDPHLRGRNRREDRWHPRGLLHMAEDSMQWHKHYMLVCFFVLSVLRTWSVHVKSSRRTGWNTWQCLVLVLTSKLWFQVSSTAQWNRHKILCVNYLQFCATLAQEHGVSSVLTVDLVHLVLEITAEDHPLDCHVFATSLSSCVCWCFTESLRLVQRQVLNIHIAPVMSYNHGSKNHLSNSNIARPP